MNKQFKERLTGAVILVVFVVIVVPALLSGPPRTVPAQTAASGEGPPLRTYTIDLTDPAGGTPPIATQVAPMAVAAGTPAEGSPEPAPPTVGTSVAPMAAAPATAPPTTAAAASTVAAPTPATAAPATAAPAPATAEPATAAASPAAGYAVQIGSFGERSNAERLVATLRKGGFAAFIVPTTSGRKLYRVRVGPVADRADAERLAAQLVAAGQSGRIVPHP